MNRKPSRKLLTRKVAAAVLLLATAFATTVTGPAQAAPALRQSRYLLANVNSARCLDVTYGGKDNFVHVIQYTCYGGPVQQWRLQYVSGTGSYLLVNVNSGKCLDVIYGNREDRAPVVQYTCHGGANQRWRLQYVSGTGSYLLVNINSGKCLDVFGGGRENFVPVIQYACYGGPVQQWQFRYLGA